MSYSLGAIDLGTVTNEEVTKDCQLFQFPMPRNDSNELIGLDLFGVQKTITLSGVKTGTTAELITFVSQLQGAANGVQTTLNYVSDLHGTVTPLKVLIQSVRWKYEAGSPSKVEYDLTLMEAASVS